MKKKAVEIDFIYKERNRRFLVLLLMSIFLGIGSQGYAQSNKEVTINIHDASIRAVLDILEKDTQMHFMYEEEAISFTRKVTLIHQKAPLTKVLDDLCKQASLRYEMKKDIVLIYPQRVEQTKSGMTPVEVRGIVYDDKGLVLPGVNVLVSDTTIRTITDVDGKYAIRVTPGSPLTFSFIGMEDKTIYVRQDTKVLNVHMEQKSIDLSDVVVTGYAQTTIRKMTGSVGVLTAADIKNKPQPNIDALLQGQVAGVNVSALTGQPGKTQKIRVRGTSTILGDGEPLWVVDGVPMQNADAFREASAQIRVNNYDEVFTSGVAGINPNDIENIYILKDASATAIYGSRGANGVVVLTTKRGSVDNKIRVSYSGNMSVTMSPQRDAKLMNAAEKIEFEQSLWDEFSKNKYDYSLTVDPQREKIYYPVVGIVGMVRSGNGYAYNNNPFKGMTIGEQDAYLESLKNIKTDWYNELFRNGISTGHYLSLSGGNDKTAFFSSVGYNKESGLLKRNDYERYNFRLNLDVTPNDRVKVSLGVDFAYNYSKAPALGSVDPFTYAYFANPYETPYNEDGSYRPDQTYYSLPEYNNFNSKIINPGTPASGFNIMRELNETNSKNKRTATTIRGGLMYNLTERIKLEGLLSYTYSSNKIDEIYGANTLAAFKNRMIVDNLSKKEYASILQTTTNNSSYLARAQASYNNTFGEIHAISLYAGTELRGSQNKSLISKRFGYDPVTGNNTTPLPPTGAGSSTIESYFNELDRSSGQSISEARFASFYATLDYYLKSKYIFNVSFRADGYSNFGSDEQFNPTWSTGFAWHVGDEKFFSNLKPVVDWLTLRTAFGYTGNVISTSVVAPQIILSYYDVYRYSEGNAFRTGSVAGAPNSRLRWEKTQDMKASLDVGFWGGRLSGLFEVYYRKGKDLIESVSVLSSTGFTIQKFNAMSMENKGLEFTVKGVPVKTKDLKIDVSANFSINRNKITNFKPTYSDMSYGNNWEGYPKGAIYSSKYDGIDPVTGLYAFKLRPDVTITSASDLRKSENYRYYLGTREAPYVGGLSMSASYKNLRLSVFGSYSLGAKMFDEIRPPVSYSSVPGGGEQLSSTQTTKNDVYRYHVNTRREAFNRWTVNNPTGTYPRIFNVYEQLYDIDGYRVDKDYYPSEKEITQSVFLEKLSYLRIKNIILSYALPKTVTNNMGISSASASMSLNNFFTFTNYNGMDPEVPGATYPITRSITFTLNIDF